MKVYIFIPRYCIIKMLDGNIWMKTTIRMIAIAAIIAGGINWFAVAFGYNLVDLLNSALSRFFKKQLSLNKVIYFIVGISAIVLAFDRTLWLPFLGESVLPSVLIPLSSNSATANANGSGSFPVKSKIITLIVCILFGWGGFHRFYTGHVIVGLLYMFSFGMLGIGWALDTLWILLGSFKDANGQLLK